MPQYDFRAPSVRDAIEEVFVRRAMEERQRMEDEFRRRQAEEQSQRQASELGLRRQQESRIAEAQAQQQRDLETERGFRRATTIASSALPGDPVDEPTAGLLREHGYGGQVRQGQPTQGAFLGEDESMIPQYDVLPGILEMRGGSQFLNAQAQREAAASTAAANRASADERASESNATRELIARLGIQGSNTSRELQNEMTRLRIDAERTKQEQAEKERSTAASGVTAGRQRIRDLAQGLIADPALNKITGTIEGRRDTFVQGQNVDALRRLNQLVSALSVEERGKLKGQGAISNFEAQMLAQAVSAIDRAAGPEIVRRHLKAIVDSFQGDTPLDGAQAGPVSVVAPNGKTYTFDGQEKADAFKRQAGIP